MVKGMKKKTPLLAVLLTLFLVTLSACTAVPQAGALLTAGLPEQSEQPIEVLPVAYEPTLEAAAAVDIQSALVRVYQQANPAVVYILTAIGSGSGFVYDMEGHIVTNNHVVSGSGAFEVVFSGGERQRATLVGADLDSDLAVLKVDSLPQGVLPLPLADFESVQVGQIVAAIGNPFGEQGSMSMGIVSGVDRSLPSQRSAGLRSTYTLPEVIQTDAPINPGNSGGPLLNLDGEVIGVNSAIASNTGANSGVGFAIPVGAVSKIVPSLIENGEYIYSYMGAGFDDEVSLSEQALYGISQTQGAYVLNITAGGPADQAGLRPADANTGKDGDLIVAVDGNPVKNFAELNSYLVFHTAPGQTIELAVLRGEQQVSILLTLGARP
jgi:2-alkenal reductase